MREGGREGEVKVGTRRGEGWGWWYGRRERKNFEIKKQRRKGGRGIRPLKRTKLMNGKRRRLGR